MEWIKYNQSNLTENAINLEFENESLLGAKKIDGLWKVILDDLDLDFISQDPFDLKNDIDKFCHEKKEQELYNFYEDVVAQRKELMKLPVISLAKSRLDVELQNHINKHIKYFDDSSLLDGLNKELSFLKGLENQLSKIPSYSKLFAEVVKGLNPKATRNVFEINVQKFLKDLSISHLIALPENPSMPQISKAFFKQERGSVSEIISHLN